MTTKVRLRWQLLVVGAIMLWLAGCAANDPQSDSVASQDSLKGTSPARGGARDPKNDIVGTWQRKHQGKLVEQLTFSADGTYETFNPQTGGTRESGRYSISADGTYRHMRPTGGPNYKCRIQFKGKDVFEDSQQLVYTTLEFRYERVKQATSPE
jgi:hypothetical protein